MDATREDIIRWFNSGLKMSMDYLFILSTDKRQVNVRPRYCKESNFDSVYNLIFKDGIDIIEVYDLSMDQVSQIDCGKRVYNTGHHKIEVDTDDDWLDLVSQYDEDEQYDLGFNID